MMENMELEEKIDIDDLVLPSKPMKLDKIVIFAVKEEPFESEERYSTKVSMLPIKSCYKRVKKTQFTLLDPKQRRKGLKLK